MVVVKLLKETLVRGLWEEAFFIQQGKDAHLLKKEGEREERTLSPLLHRWKRRCSLDHFEWSDWYIWLCGTEKGLSKLSNILLLLIVDTGWS